MVILTIKKQAPSKTAFIFTSRSICTVEQIQNYHPNSIVHVLNFTGKLIPNTSASVTISLRKPPHCFEIFPTFVSPSLENT